MTDKELVDAAIEAMNRAYAPYSDFFVGAAVLTSDGRLFTGCNIENSSYGATICAERCAVAKAVSKGCRVISKIAVCGGKHGNITDFCPPCGICRQVISEFSAENTEILLFDGKVIKAFTEKELLPLEFKGKNIL